MDETVRVGRLVARRRHDARHRQPWSPGRQLALWLPHAAGLLKFFIAFIHKETLHHELPPFTLIGHAIAAASRRTVPRPCSPSAPSAQAAYKSEYKMSLVVGPPPFPGARAAKIWANLVKERTNGRINIKLYPGVSLIQGDQTREFSALRQGVIDMADRLHHQLVAAGEGTQPVLAALPDARLRSHRRADAGRGRQGHLRRASTRPAWSRSRGARTATARSPIRSAPIQSPEDLKGMKIRVVGSPLFARHLHRPGRQPHADELGRRPARASRAARSTGRKIRCSIFTVPPSCRTWARRT